MSGPRRVLDVSGLTTVPFGSRSLLWWGTVGFMVIEGFTLLLMAASYFYLRTNEFDWPPGRTPNPELLIPTINTVLLLLVIVPMMGVAKAASRMDRRGVVRGLLIATALSIPVNVLRWFELLALGARWDAHAYASAAWGLVVLHSTLVIVDVFETGTLAALFLMGKAKRKHYPDAKDAAEYQYFLSLIWVPVYVIVYWMPRLL
ncbi:MAG TPA: cytochrome c oxidase subunit 3 [Longimicrobium sp.]|jgi:heme/copper-type cytochrome/quinol oxidase subunit 3|nr:cytochrome c oxidase subunit 3 [Longimicrobium sp.]